MQKDQQADVLLVAFNKMNAEERDFYVELFRETVAGRADRPQLTLVSSGFIEGGPVSPLRRHLG
jgi:hypothetical protein